MWETPSSLGHLLLLFQAQGAGSQVEYTGFELAPIWDTSISGGNLTHYATRLAPLSVCCFGGGDGGEGSLKTGNYWGG